MGVDQPVDYPPAPRRQKDCAKFPWLPVVLALLVPTVYAVFLGGAMSNRMDVLAQDVEDNGEAISTTPNTFVPRNELDAKLENIQLQVGSVQANVEDLKEQSERQTAQILRRLERMDTPRRDP